jgi:integrase/recombinase XerD
LQGVRDYAMMMTLYNSGARVQELCDLKMKDLRLVKPYMVTVTGKGQKTRHVPLWESTVQALKAYLKDRYKNDSKEFVFMGKRGERLSRFGVRYLVQMLAKKGSKQCSGLSSKKIGPHTLRHTTAMHLLQAGVEINVIKEWLGHVDLNTTHGYVEIDMKMKEEALKKTSPPKTKTRVQSLIKKEKTVLEWLEAL